MLFLFLVICCRLAGMLTGDESMQLVSRNNNFISAISGFTIHLQCNIHRCGREQPTIAWYKNDVLIFNGTDFQPTSGIEPASVMLQQTTLPESSQNACAIDEYTLLLRNLTSQDTGRYRCQLHRQLQQLDFQVDVLESNLKASLSKYVDFDIAGCCAEQEMSSLCRPMCRPKEMNSEYFDPSSCTAEDYKSFLYCATNGGNLDFIPCCQERSVPSFCNNFCSYNFSVSKHMHRLCLYFLPDILGCFSHPLPPSPPKNLQIRRARQLLCWRSGDESEQKLKFSVHVREAPSLLITSKSKSLFPESNHLRSERLRRAVAAESTVLVVHDSTLQSQTRFVRLNADQVEQHDNEVCISLVDLRQGVRYVFYVQSANAYGISNPSAALFSVI